MKVFWKRLLIAIPLILIVIFTAFRFGSLKNEHIETSTSLSSGTTLPEPDVTIQESEYINEETQKLIFGKWEVSKLIGFTKVQNDYTNYPNGHDIIGDDIIINEKRFSSKGLSKYERYQSEISEPTYSLSGIKEQLLIVPNESSREEPEIYDMIEKCNFEWIYIKDKFNKHASVSILLASDKHLILEMDGEFYLLSKKSM